MVQTLFNLLSSLLFSLEKFFEKKKKQFEVFRVSEARQRTLDFSILFKMVAYLNQFKHCLILSILFVVNMLISTNEINQFYKHIRIY